MATVVEMNASLTELADQMKNRLLAPTEPYVVQQRVYPLGKQWVAEIQMLAAPTVTVLLMGMGVQKVPYDGNTYDFAGDADITINPSSITYRKTKELPPGNYTANAVYQTADEVWHNAPSMSFTVAPQNSNAAGRAVLAANITNSTNSLANATGLQLPTDLALGKYKVSGQLLLISNDVTAGCQVGFTGTSTQTGPAIRVQAQSSATALVNRYFNYAAGNWGGTQTSNATSLSPAGTVMHASIDGTITVTAAPTTFTGVTFRASKAAVTVELKEGSYLEWEPLT